MKLRHLAVITLVAACTTNDPLAEVEPNALGVTRLEIDHPTPTSVNIRAYDETGGLRGELAARVGVVAWAPDLGDPTQDVVGRKLTVQVGDAPSIDHTSAGLRPVYLPTSRSFETDELLRLAQVRGVLDELGIHFRFERAGVESAYVGDATMWMPCDWCNYAGCAGAGAYTAACGANQITDGQEELRCCGGSSKVAASRTCTTPNGESYCGINGPGGCAVCWSTNYNYYCDIWTNEESSYCVMEYQ